MAATWSQKASSQPQLNKSGNASSAFVLCIYNIMLIHSDDTSKEVMEKLKIKNGKHIFFSFSTVLGYVILNRA